MTIKKCIGCRKEVEDKTGLGIATICNDCALPLDNISEKAKEMVCNHCGGQTNFIGALICKGVPVLYFDCPNPECSEHRINIIVPEIIIVDNTVEKH